MKKIFLIYFLMVVCYIHAQPPTRFYTKFGGDGDDIGYSAKQTLDGHYIIAGSTSSYGNGNTDVYLTKMDSMGQLMWSKMYGGFNNDIGKSVIQLSDSGFVVAGFTNSYGAGGYDAYIIKTDKHGNQIWQTTFGGLDWDFADDLVLGSDNHIYVVGNTSSFGSGKKDGFVLKYDLFGTLVWQKFIGGAENEELRSIIKTNDNFLATVGFTESKGEINGDGYFLKLDLNGDTLFTRTFGGGGKDFANDVVQKVNDDYVLCGAKTFTSYTESYMYCLNSVGTFSWQNNYTKTLDGDEAFVSVCNSRQLDYLNAFIRTAPFFDVALQVEIFVATPGGWKYKINDTGEYDDEYGFSLEPTRDGGFIIVGSTKSFNSLGTDVFFMKHDSTCFFYQSIVKIDELKQFDRPRIYQNYDDNLVVEFSTLDKPRKISLSDLNGRIVHETTIFSGKATLDISNLESHSFYILNIEYDNDRRYRQKIIK